MSNTSIAIPPFPCQDLAKLVLGYLAEEQLMTAYDEFLQSSPYLDAFRNEYDRIFMTSLKNILAEYRAVKIYVETCKPFILRRKLFQCTNLLEIVKFLINHVDLNKIQAQEGGADKTGPTNQTTSQIEATPLGNSVETTSLADLPGNTSYKRFIAKMPDIGSNFSPNISSEQNKDGNTVKCPVNLCTTSIESSDTTDNVISSMANKNYSANRQILVNDLNPKPQQRVQDLNYVLNLVSHKRNESASNHKDFISADNVSCKRITSEANFQNLPSGVDSSSSSINKVIVPDSSTSENIVLQPPTTETDNIKNSMSMNQASTRIPLSMKIRRDHKNINLYPNQTLHNLPRLTIKDSSVWKSAKSNIEEQNSPKITIISDVKVDNDIKMPPILKNINSAPLVQMQTLFINGTPVYKQTPQAEQKYTKDEIMAMPTIILVPASGAPKKTVSTVTQNNMLDNSENPTIDITASDDDPSQIDNTVVDSSVQDSQKNTNDNETSKAVEVACHGSLPKDTLISLKTSTPHVLPPTRKSSSTPRRTSHIRVLDFTTPRRILHENLSEQVAGGSSSHETPSETVSLPLSNKNNTEPTINKPSNIPDTVHSSDVDKGPTKENKASIKLYNWDSQLRALAYVGNGNIEKPDTIEKPKTKKSKKKISPAQHQEKSKVKHDKESSSVKKDKKVTPKNRGSKLKSKYSEVTDVIEVKTQDTSIIPTVPVKPTINIVSRNKWNPPEIDKTQSKSNNSDEHIDTPEMERMSLQNEIGAKLNISDLLETPYKQALYDIQMDTPRFLGTDLPDDPLSDIKISSIPTPRFLNTPKLTQNTPSSYSSRPTDYSSGGSYYKPDDQEYVISTDIIECAHTDSASTSNINKEADAVEVNVSIQKTSEGKSRPVRKCTKNVSYNYNSPIINKMKDIDDKTERSSTCSDISTSKSDKNVDKLNKSEKYNKKEKISVPKKRTKKYKSPVKKETPKTFMKIKPRRTTPVKEVLGKGRKKSTNYSPNIYIKPQPKKMTAGKERNVSFMPALQVPVSTKSKRKSSSPRKLNCSKMFNSGNARFNSPESTKQISKSHTVQVPNLDVYCDSDADQLPLRWSDDASQESKSKTSEVNRSLTNETDDITKIKEYISTTIPNSVGNIIEGEGNLQVDLIRRGFDVETARMIERDLLETPSQNVSNLQQPAQIVSGSVLHNNIQLETKKADKSIESDCSTSNNLEIVQDVDDNDDFDLSVHDCNEDTNNYFSFKYDEVKFAPTDQVKLKETFSMEICIEDDVAIRLRAMPFNTVFEHESKHENVEECNEITAHKPGSFDTLYTPRKAQCYEIFDSTLASLDTPLKSNSPKARELETVTEIVLEVEKLENDIKQKPETKKRKRLQTGTSDESSNSNKKVKADTPYILNSKSIQNMDIESVLSKLHGP